MTELPGWLDELSEGVLLVAGHRVRWLNRAAAKMLEVERSLALGAPVIAVLREHRLERALLDRQPVVVDTRGRWLEASPFDGGMTLADVSEVKRSQERAQTLLAVLSHELRTPATTIGSALEALRHDLDERQRERFLDHAQAESNRLVRLLEDLTVGAKPPRYRRLELATLVERAARILAPRFRERRVELVVEVGDILVWSDEDKLLQAVLNLLENAVLHGPAESTVSIEAGLDDESEGQEAGQRPSERRVAVRVRDLGKPLDPVEVDSLFEPHSRGGRGSGKGSGLGLYVVRSIVDRWGGRAWGKPSSRGNEFGFTVPVAGGNEGSS